jgi:uncharacterized RDD family membrane protein YckC
MNTSAAQQNRYAPPSAEVSDAPEEAGELAGRGTRLVAAILDGLIFMLLFYTPIFVTIGGTAFMQASTSGQMAIWRVIGAALFSSGGIVALIGLIVFATLNIYFVTKNGQSIGKKLMGIKLVRTDGSKAGLGRIFWLRNAIGFVIGVIPLVGGLYSLIDSLMIFSEPRRCVHDRIADTIVIKA